MGEEMRPGDKVRLIANPGQVGILGNETDGPPHRLRVLVTFLDGEEQFILKGSLEKMEHRPPGPYAEIARGRYGRVEDLRGLMTYYRLSGRLANLIYSLNTTNTQFLAYQFKPVLHFLDSPCNGILIADEVGLGKTIEAGLIWTELRARMDAKRLLVVCPAMLREKWKMELADRFGVQADLVDAGELRKRLQAVRERPQDSFALVASIQGLRPPKGWNDKKAPSQSTAAKLGRFLDDADLEDPLLDMVVIDEAHYLRNRETQNNRLGTLLRPVTQNLVMLSATPIQMRSTDLFNLLHLLDEDAFPYEYSFEHTLRANAPIVALRDRALNSVMTRAEFVETLDDALVARIFEDNEQIEHLRNNPPSDEELASPQGRSEIAERLDRINPLAKVVTRTLKRDVQEMRVTRVPVAIKISMSPVEHAFYHAVTDEVREFCADMEISTGFMLTIPQRQMSSCMAAACRGWIEKMGKAIEDEMDELVYESFGDTDNGSNEKPKLGTLLKALVRIAHQVGDFSALSVGDSKYAELIKNLKGYWDNYPGNKVVLFSFYRPTLRYLSERLAKDGVRSVIVQGGMDKHEALRQFASQEGPNILLSSEVAAEGVDLQFSSLLINYDLPWNPMRIEQRIGRIDRIGQEAEKILIWNLVYEDTVDDRVYERLLERLNIFRQALGSMEAVLGEKIRELGYELLSHKLTPEEELARINLSSVAIETINRQQQQLESDATQLIAHGEFIQNKVRAARELGRYIRGEDLLAYVGDFLYREYPGTRLIQSDHNPMEASLAFSTEARVRFSDFLSAQRLLGRTTLLSSHPPKLLFENCLGKVTPGLERVTQEHPLVRFVAEQLKASGKGTGYAPVSAIELPFNTVSGFAAGSYVYAVARWTVSGSRDVERLEYVVMSLKDGSLTTGEIAEHLVNTAAMSGSDWVSAMSRLDHPAVADMFDQCKALLEQRFKSFREDCMREDRDRIKLMVNMLERHLDGQRSKIKERIDHYRHFGTDQQRKLIPAEEGRLRKVTERLNNRMEELRLKERAAAAENFVSGGVIQLV
jgi:SNF2 family DNA or RNA helicase